MKTRLAFVANSSSSSFIIKLKDLTNAQQLHAIENHITYAQKHFPWIECVDDFQWWDISVDEEAGYVHGTTWMDNFDMHAFLKAIDVPADAIEWGDW